MKIIPAMDIIDKQVVRLQKGDYNQKTIYSDDPIAQALIFKNNGIERLHLVDLSGAKEKKPCHIDLFTQIKKETGLIIECGGGIRNLSDVDKYFNKGLNIDEDFIMIGSLPFKNPKEFQKIVNKYAKNILMTVDVWGREIKISGWMENTNKNIFDFLREMIELKLNHFLITQIKKDGMLAGMDIDLYKEVLHKFPDIQLIASGGMTELNDIKQLKQIENLYGAILGKAYYEKRISLDDLI